MSGNPNMNLNYSNLWKVSRFLNDANWLELGWELNVPDLVLTNIDKNHNFDYRDCAYNMLKSWHDQNKASTVQDLIIALNAINWTSPILEIEEYFNNEARDHESRMTGSHTEDAIKPRRQIIALSGDFEERLVGTAQSGGSNTNTLPRVKQHYNVVRDDDQLDPTTAFQSEILSNTQLNENIIWAISEGLTSTRWVELGHQLEISQSKLGEIREEYRHRHRESAFQMLLAWHEYNPTFIVKHLFKALEQIGWKSSIEHIEKCLHKHLENRSSRGKDVEKPSCRRQVVENLSSPVTKSSIALGKITIKKIIKSEGHGTIVYKGLYEGREAAIKKVPMELSHLAANEIQTLIMVDCHPNIITYFGQEKDNSHMYIALELGQCNLEDFCTTSRFNAIRRKKRDKCLLREITEGLSYIHAALIVHGDIKPQNILISQPNYLGTIKAFISDFGLSKTITGRQKFPLISEKKATGGWTALEVIRNPKQKAFASDVFSLGCIYYYVMTNGKQIFYSDYDVEFRPDMKHLEYNAAFRIIVKMINRNPTLRPSCTDVLEDIFHIVDSICAAL